MKTDRSDKTRTNRQIAEEIKADLNELIDHRGNPQLIPALIRVQSFLDHIAALERQLLDLDVQEAYR